MKRQLFLIFLSCVFVTLYGSTNNSFRELPPGFLPFEEFEKEFQLGETSTEQLNPITKILSQTMHRSISEGLEQLLQVDENVSRGLKNFIPSIELLAPQLAEKIGKRGRIFLVGSGSSGRVAIDIAAKCKRAFPGRENQILGAIAGGDSALVRAKEGFEDSEADGKKALQRFHLNANDTVILISASGSASFNVGCGHFSADCGASVFYFYNSRRIPSRTQHLFDRASNPAIPLCVDIGPQAIAGSTRLQGATLAEAGLGSLLASALYLNKGENELAKHYPLELVEKMQEGIRLIRTHMDEVAQFVIHEKEIFSNPRSNFRQLRDQTNEGYVTFIASEDCMREVLIDATETSPTFSTNPIGRESEKEKKRAEFQAYLVGKDNNRKAWEALVGRGVSDEDTIDTENFILSSHVDGMNSYKNRPVSKGNILIGVAKLKEAEKVKDEIIQLLEEASVQGGQTGLLLICRGKYEIQSIQHSLCVIDNVPSDSLGLVETIILKQVLNLISNGSMVLMNKVHGNQMIDVRASNNKLIDRCMRLTREIWNEYRQDFPFTNEQLYHCVVQISAIKKAYEKNGIYTPSIVKLILAMMALKKTPEDFQQVSDYLRLREERIDWIGE